MLIRKSGLKGLRRLAIALSAVFALGTMAAAEGLLTLQNAGISGQAQAIELDSAMIDSLPQHTVKTRNEFVDDVTAFTGPLAIDVINLIGRGAASKVRLTAANDYSIEIDLAELDRYGVIFATAMNGERLSPRDKGPVWVIYPMDQHQELSDPVWNNRLIWQLVRVELL